MSAQSSTADQIRSLLTEQFPDIQLAILFGSLATGEGRPDSDVDLAVLGPAPLGPEQKSAIISAVGEKLGRPVDLVDLKTAGEPLLGEVLDGKRILGNSTAYAQLLYKHLIEVADFVPLQQRLLKERRDKWINS